MTQLQSDIYLLERYVHHKDSQAFAEIVSRYTGPIYATSRRILRDRAMAEEATQETFARLIDNAGMITRSLGGWLHRTATLISIDMVRRDASRRHREAFYAADNPRQADKWDDVSPVIDEALDALPEDERAILVDHFLLGKSQAELADEHSVSPATMSRRMQQSLEALRAVLRQRGLLVATAALSAWIATQAADAAPVTLTREVGKMALLQSARHGLRGGTGAGTGIGGAGADVRGIVWISIGGVGSMAAIICMALLWSHPGIFHIDRPTVAPPGEMHGGYTPIVALRMVTIPGATTSADASRVVGLFQDPATSNGSTLTVYFRDFHQEQLPMGVARKLVESQTNKTLEELVSEAKSPTTPAAK